jgi:hypothetical protein
VFVTSAIQFDKVWEARSTYACPEKPATETCEHLIRNLGYRKGAHRNVLELERTRIGSGAKRTGQPALINSGSQIGKGEINCGAVGQQGHCLGEAAIACE